MNPSQAAPDVRVTEIGWEQSAPETDSSRAAGAFKQDRVRQKKNSSREIAGIVAGSVDLCRASVKIENAEHPSR
jgi:hypothetical protein